MRKILIIEQHDLLRELLREKLEKFKFEVVLSRNGFDGLIKIKNENPDLIIMDSLLDRLSSLELLKEKAENKVINQIPVIILSNKADTDIIEKFARYRIYKFFTKPLKIDTLLSAVSELFKIKLAVDMTPCIIDTHLNDDILFIEIADGLNREKVGMLKYKLIQMKEIYHSDFTKILIIMTNIQISENLGEKLEFLFDVITENTEAEQSGIKVLTTTPGLNAFVDTIERYDRVEIKKDFTEAIDSFGKIDIFAYGQEIEDIKTELISNSRGITHDERIELKFSNDTRERNIKKREDYVIAVVDDDLHILEFMATALSQTGWKINTYENGKLFVEDLSNGVPDLVYLDLMMPEMNGFDVIKYLKDNGIETHIVIITALTQKDAVLTARNYGVTSYLTKPINSDLIINKAEEIFNMTF